VNPAANARSTSGALETFSRIQSARHRNGDARTLANFQEIARTFFAFFVTFHAFHVKTPSMPPPQQQWPVPNKLFLAAYPTPNNSDFYLYRHEDTRNIGYVSPIYGDPVPEADRVKYPNHFCTKIVPNAQAGDGWVTVIYASELAPQDDDNYDIEYPEGVNAFPTITRTYIYLRSEYAESGPLAVGTADPGLLPNGDAQFPDAILSEAEKMVEGTGDPLIDSLFVKVTRKFQRIPNLADAGDLAEAKTFGYKVEYPYGDTGYPRVTWTIPCTSETPAAFGSACPIAGYTSLELIDQQYVNAKGVVIGASRIYEKVPGAAITSYDIDGETLTDVSITKQLVENPGADYPQVAGSEIVYRALSAAYGHKITTTLLDFAGISITKQSTIQIRYPSVVTGSPTCTHLEGNDGAVIVNLNWPIVAGGSRQANATTTFTYAASPSQDSANAYFTPELKDLVFNGLFYNVSIRGVAVNGTVAVPDFNTASDNPKWGYVAVVGPSWTGTSGASAFLSAVSGIVFSCDIQNWKYNLRRKALTTVTG
jgi:hypothetical protein